MRVKDDIRQRKGKTKQNKKKHATTLLDASLRFKLDDASRHVRSLLKPFRDQKWHIVTQPAPPLRDVQRNSSSIFKFSRVGTWGGGPFPAIFETLSALALVLRTGQDEGKDYHHDQRTNLTGKQPVLVPRKQKNKKRTARSTPQNHNRVGTGHVRILLR
ncbi:unnamed protein product, partial [Ectocarpus sp. 13 AM-2016]